MATSPGQTDQADPELFEQTFDVVCGSIGRGKAGRSASIVLDRPPTDAEMTRWSARAAAFSAHARLDGHGVIIVEPRPVSASRRVAGWSRLRLHRERLRAWWAGDRPGRVSVPILVQAGKPE